VSLLGPTFLASIGTPLIEMRCGFIPISPCFPICRRLYRFGPQWGSARIVTLRLYVYNRADMLNRLMRGFFFVLIKLLSRPRIEGLENMPESGAFLVVSNHTSMADIPMGLTFLGDREIKGWVAAKWSSHPLLAPIVRMSGGIFILRGEVDRSALQEAVDWLKSGRPFALAPEGTRSRQGALQRGKTGAAYLAAEANVQVLPTAYIGTDEAMRTIFRRLRRPRITLRIGRPFMLPPLDGNSRAASLRENTDELMCRIAALLPPRYWGHYADHPRVRELLEQAKGGSPAGEDTDLRGQP